MRNGDLAGLAQRWLICAIALACRERGILWRYGAVGSHASIAIIERFWRTLKEEGLRRAGLLPRKLRAMQALVDDFAAWYNEHRPHQGIGGLAPEDRAAGEVHLVANPAAAIEAGARVVVVPFRGRAHLPVVELRDAA